MASTSQQPDVDLVEAQYLAVEKVAKDAIQQMITIWDVDVARLMETVRKWIEEAPARD